MTSTSTRQPAAQSGGHPDATTPPRTGSFASVPPWLFYAAMAVAAFNYFDIHHNLWFLQLLNGYVIKMWLPPLVLVVLALALTRRFGRLGLTPRSYGLPNLLLALYVLFGMLSLIRNESPYEIGKYGLIMFGPLTLYAAVVIVCDDTRRIEKLLGALFWSGVALSLYVFYLYDVAGVESWRDRPLLLRYMWSDHVEHFALRLNYHQHETYFAFSRTLKLIDEPAFAAMLAPLALLGFHRASRQGTLLRVLYYIPAAFLFYTLLNTASRAAFVALVAVLPVFFWILRKRWIHVLVILTVVTAMTFSNGFMQYRMVQLAGTIVSKIEDHMPVPAVSKALQNWEQSIASRVALHPEGHVESIAKTSEDIQAAPLLGSGVSRLLRKYSSDGTGWGTEHNRYLYIAATAGLLTAGPYMLFIGALALACFVIVRRLPKEDENRETGVFLFSTAILFAIQLNNCGMERYYYWVFFALAAAWLKNTMNGKGHENPAH